MAENKASIEVEFTKVEEFKKDGATILNIVDEMTGKVKVLEETATPAESVIGAVGEAIGGVGGAAENASGSISGTEEALSSLAENAGISGETARQNTELAAAAMILQWAAVARAINDTIVALIALSNETAEYGDGVQKGAQKIDFSTDAYQRWDYVLQKNGSSMKQAQGAITKLTENTAKGSDKTAAALEELGIGLEEAQEMSGAELFESVVSALQDVPDAGERAALASDLMGGSYKQLGTLLSSTAEETDNLKQRAEELGLVMSESGIEAAGRYQSNIEDLNSTLDGISRTIGEQLIPVIEPAQEALQNLLTSVDWAGLGSALASALGPAVQFLNDFIIPIASVALSGVVATLKLLFDILNGIGTAGGGLLGGMTGKTEVDTLLGEGLSVDELEEKVAAAKKAFEDAQTAVQEGAEDEHADMISLINQMNAREQELQIATEAYRRAKEALEGGGEGGEGEGGETPSTEETAAEIQATVAETEAATTGMLENVTNTAGEINAQYQQGVDEASQAAVEAIENTHEVMDTNMAQLGTNAYIWGVDMMTNLANGIVDGSNQLVLPAVNQLASEIEARLGFSEPDKGPLSDFHTFAPDMMALFAQGIRDGRGLIAAAIGQSFDLGPMIAAQNAGQTLNYGGVSVQIYGAPGQSVDELYDVFSYRLARDVADREAVFST